MKNLLLLVALSLGLILGCVSKQPKTKPAPKIVVKKVEKGPKISAEDVVRIAFESPVVGVDGTRSEKADDPFAVERPRIVKEYKKNATHDISIAFQTSDGEEKVIHGTIKVNDYKASKPEIGEQGKLILISPDNNLAYEDIWRNGYGRMVAYEISPGSFKEKGAEIVQLVLGSRKKKSSGVEFHFYEGNISSVNEKYTPYNLIFPTNSKQNIDLTLDEGLVAVKAQLEIFKGNEYTNLAPVFVDLDEDTKEKLRRGNGSTKIAITVPNEEYLGNRNRIVVIQPGQDPVREGSKFGTVVAVMKLKQVSKIGY